MCHKYQKHMHWLKYGLRIGNRPISSVTESLNDVVSVVINKIIYGTCYISLQFDHNLLGGSNIFTAQMSFTSCRIIMSY